MFIHLRRRSEKSGFPPGTPVFVGDKIADTCKITIVDYDKDNFDIRVSKNMEGCSIYREKPTVTWINIQGLHEVSVIEEAGNCFDLHPLTVEDILNTEQRPKIDFFDAYGFVVMKTHMWDATNGEIDVEQVSLVLGTNFVLTFQEKEGDAFEAVRDRLKNNKGRIRKLGADYLAYALIDSLVDSYFTILEKIGDEIEAIEEELVAAPKPETLNDIHFLKRELIYLRKSVWPLREIINKIQREEAPLIQESTTVYLRDLYDHTIQIIDTVETFGDVISGMLDVYLSSLSNKLNEIMKILTLFAAIFIPLTLIAGIYGMNFSTQRSPYNMPELEWYYGYPFALGLMVFTGIALYLFFRKKKWI